MDGWMDSWMTRYIDRCMAMAMALALAMTMSMTSCCCCCCFVASTFAPSKHIHRHTTKSLQNQNLYRETMG